MGRESDIISRVLLTTEQYKGSFTAFRSAVLLNEYNAKSQNFSRLLIWKTCLLTETLNIPAWDLKLLASRAVYHLLRRNPEMAVPWSKLERDNEFYLLSTATAYSQPTFGRFVRINDVGDDPLGSNNAVTSLNSATNTSMPCDDLELLNAIVLDVQRLFPGEKFFNDGSDSAHAAKRQLITILYTWGKCNPNIGYKQGIHEILGLIYLNMIRESLSLLITQEYTAEDMKILSLYNLQYLEHDVFALFNRFVVSSGLISAFYETEARLMLSIESFNSLLMKVDQLIHYNLITKLRLETSLWIIRFLRLLLLRELSNELEIPSLLWDKLVAVELEKPAGQTCLSELIICMTVVMLIHLKTELMLCDFSEALSLLLHYPITAKMKLNPDFMSYLFEDSYNLHSIRNKDLKLYEYGLKLNRVYNPRIKASVESSSRSVTPSSANVVSPESSIEIPSSADIKAANLRFERSRLEARLKKKAQEMLNHS